MQTCLTRLPQPRGEDGFSFFLPTFISINMYHVQQFIGYEDCRPSIRFLTIVSSLQTTFFRAKLDASCARMADSIQRRRNRNTAETIPREFD